LHRQICLWRSKRLNPEAPVPILNYKRVETKQGMAWNVYNNLKSFGLDVYMMTNEEKIIKTRYIDEKTNQQILRVDEEVHCKPMDCEIPNEKYDAIVISDYDKGFITSRKCLKLHMELSVLSLLIVRKLCCHHMVVI
jgi:bifunctional ADP-heptose synthase (sugar kinase/adenylyltransferase)